MPTYGEQILMEFAEALISLKDLVREQYEPKNVREILTTLGSKTELFLKSIVFPAEKSANTFAHFIDQLLTTGLAQSAIDPLHRLRIQYNKAKHESGVVIPLLVAECVVREARASIESIVSGHIGLVDAAATPHLHRVFWVAAWDHFVHGDTEVHVVLPVESDHWLGPPLFDMVNIDGREWDAVRRDLAQAGTVVNARGVIPGNIYEGFEQEGDFAGALVYEGDYRRLITLIATKELRLPGLLPGLSRHDNSSSMINAFLLASVDVAVVAVDDAELVEKIQRRAIGVYAVPADFAQAESMAAGMAAMFRQVPLAEWRSLMGPVWVGAE